MKDFRSLKVWEKAHALTLTIYKSTVEFPKQELYALTNQIQRARRHDLDSSRVRAVPSREGSTKCIPLLARSLGHWPATDEHNLVAKMTSRLVRDFAVTHGADRA